MHRYSILSLILLSTCILAQDPAEGWLGYAAATYPTGRITYIEATWIVPDNPAEEGAFYSPWFGIEASDNLNLIQPVNPWIEDHWEIYNEYFQWEPENNIDSDSNTVSAGDVIFGSVTYIPANQSYTMFHQDVTTGWSVSTNIPIQNDPNTGLPKNYTIAYFVMEKDADCNQYPANGQVLFKNIQIKYDNKIVVPTWTTGVVDDICNCRAHVVTPSSIQITWNTSNK